MVQVTVHYTQKNGALIPRRVHTVVISVQHDDFVSLDEQKDILREKVIKAVVPAKYLDEHTIYHLQPSGRFVIGGPQVSYEMFISYSILSGSTVRSAVDCIGSPQFGQANQAEMKEFRRKAEARFEISYNNINKNTRLKPPEKVCTTTTLV